MKNGILLKFGLLSLLVLTGIYGAFSMADAYAELPGYSDPSTFGDSGNPVNYNGYGQSGYTYGQSGYYSQSAYAPSYSQGSYVSYGQGSYSIAASSGGGGGSSYGQGSYSLSSSGYGQGGYYSCPSGYTLYNESQCCPNQYVVETDTNGSGKGGVVRQCNVPSGNNTPGGGSNVNPQTSSCTVNGETVAHGSSYTFYTQGNVPYGSSCSSVAYERVCNNGVFDGNDSGFSRCVVDDAPQIAPITITATPPIVRYGGSTTITWDGANAEACTITGYGLSNVTGVTGSAPVSNVIGESVYTLFCTLGPNTRSASTTLKVLPRTQET